MKKHWFNGTIYTMERESERVESVVTEHGTIIDCGHTSAMTEKYSGEMMEKMDLDGRTMFPGFTDSHIHLIGHGETFLRLDLSKMHTKEEVLEAVGEKAKTVPLGEWIIGEGWNENAWTDSSLLTACELDVVAPLHPVLLKRVCRHAVVVNSMALDLAEIDENTVHHAGSLIERNPEGRPTGILKDDAQQLVFNLLPDYTAEYVELALMEGIKSCWKFGLTGVHTEDLSYYGSYHRVMNAYKKVTEYMPLRIHLLVHHKVVDQWWSDPCHRELHSRMLEFGAMKIFVDGALGGRTAWLSHPYADAPNTVGTAIHAEEELDKLVQKARSYKMPIATHVIGDQAFASVLDLIEKYPPHTGMVDRLIHGQILRQDLVERAKQLPLMIDIQPTFVLSDFPWVVDRIGKENMDCNYAWKTLLEERIHCAGGSDAPIECADPLLGIHAAVTRRDPSDPNATVHMPDQCLSIFEAVSLFTTGSAYACRHEHDRGLIKKGYDADFTILDRDLFKIDENEIIDTHVSMTVVGGEVVYKRG